MLEVLGNDYSNETTVGAIAAQPIACGLLPVNSHPPERSPATVSGYCLIGDADPDIPILEQAKAEYGTLQLAASEMVFGYCANPG